MNYGEDVVCVFGVDKNGGIIGEEKKNEWFLMIIYGCGKDVWMKGKKDGNYIIIMNFFDMFCFLVFRIEIGINILYFVINFFY